MTAPCRACRNGACEDCQRLGLGCDCCTPHLDPCDCDDCRDAVEAAAELDFASLHEEGMA